MGIGAASGLAIAGVASAGAGIAGSALQAGAASSAASTEANAADYAANLQHEAGQQAAALYAPYASIGTTFGNALTSAAGTLATPWQPTQAQLESTPGYQFTLNQGLQATQNAAAARGLGVSGAALKGAASYATGLADSTYNQQFQNYETNLNDQENRLVQGTSLGLGATTNQANALIGAASQQGNYLTQGASAQAAGIVGSANAWGNALTSAGNAPLNYQVLQGLYGSGGTDTQTIGSEAIPQNSTTEYATLNPVPTMSYSGYDGG